MTERPPWAVLAAVDLRPELGEMAGVPVSCKSCHGRSCETPPRGDAWGHRWNRCPRAVVRDDAHYQAAARLWVAAQTSQLSSWPLGWAAWAVEAVTAIDGAVKARNQEGAG